jgi:5-carboxymethyl-2-hydroxymuconate isomerase
MGMMMFTDAHTSKEFRRELFKIYNAVNNDIYGYGVVSLRIVFVEDMIIFRVKHNRVHVLQVLEGREPFLKQSVDFALFLAFKECFAEKLRAETDLNVNCILRDYDPVTHTAITVVCVSEEDETGSQL